MSERIYTLDLTLHEAEIVRTLCGAVCGCPVESPRAITDKLFEKLGSMGVNYKNRELVEDEYSTIRFKKYAKYEVKEMTLEEIEKKLGHKVKIKED